jgi:hypothetical protein
MVATTLLINLVLLSILAYREIAVPGQEWWLWVTYLIFVAILGRRAWRLKRRVADLVGASATRCGFKRMGRDGKVEA